MSWRADRVRFAEVAVLQEALGVAEPLAWALVRRGLADPVQARGFLAADGPLEPPETIEGVPEAARRLARALEDGEQIVVHGDYDCDGVCSTAITALTLRARGGRVRTFLPSRFTDGYGVSVPNVERLAGEGARLLVCVDCGTTAVEALGRARELGLDVIVIDHHLAAGVRPPGILVNPALGRGRDDLPAAAGVALSVARALGALVDRGTLAPDPEELVDLAALATVADQVPLIGENRRVVARGLAAMRTAPRTGIAALCAAAGVEPRAVRARDLGFGLGPTINAAGRLADAGRGLELVMADDREAADRIARELWDLNMERRELEHRITDEAVAMIKAEPDEIRQADAIVVAGDGWHEGVVGIVASRLVERYQRPAIVITRGEEAAKGSGRSLPGVDLHALVGQADGTLSRWGGHAGAVGVQLPSDAVGRFRDDFLLAAAGARAQIARARVKIVDAVVGGRDLTLATAEQLQALEPYGRGNPALRLALPACSATGATTVGEGRHLRVRLSGGGAHAPAIGFRMGERAADIAADCRYDAVIGLQIERFQGLVGPKVVVEGLERLEPPARAAEASCAQRCDVACPDRVTGEELRALVGEEPPAGDPAAGTPLGIRDRRGEGAAIPVLAALAAADGGVVAVVADVAWRRDALLGPLEPRRLGIEVAPLAGTRCAGPGAVARLGAGRGRPVLAMVDYARLAELTLPPDVHVVAVDPPADEEQAAALRAAAAGGWLHLVWGPEEVEVAREAVRRDHDLRPLVAELWRALRGRPRWDWDAGLEAALLGDGPTAREPRAVGRALRVLAELGLVAHADGGLDVAQDPPRREIGESQTYARAQERLAVALATLDRAATLDLSAPVVLQAA